MSSTPPTSGGGQLGELDGVGALTDAVKAGQDAKAGQTAASGGKKGLSKPMKVGLVVAAVAVLAFAGWFFLLRNKGGEAPAASGTPTTAAAPQSAPVASAPATTAPATPATASTATAMSWSGTVVRSGTEWGAERTNVFMVNEPGYGPVHLELAGVITPGVGAGVPALASKAGAMLAGRTITVTSATKVKLGGAGQDRHRYKKATATVNGEDLAEKLVSTGLATRRL